MKPYLHRLLPLLVLSTPLSAMAATIFTADFNDGLANPNLTPFAGTPVYTANNAAFPASGGARYYLHTVDTNYALTGFVLEATVTLTNVDPASTAFFGIGVGTDAGAFGTPGGPAVYAEIAPQTFASGFVRFNDTAGDNSNASGATLGQGNGGWGPGSVHRVRLTWNASTSIATFQFDQNYNGTFASDFTQVFDGASVAGLNSTNNGFDGTNSTLFVGGGQGTSWDDITVVPEPSVALLGGFGMLGLLRRRRS